VRGHRVLLLLACACLAGPGCREPEREPAPPEPDAAVATVPAPVPPPPAASPEPRPLRRCFPDEPPWVDAAVDRLIDRAADRLDADDAEGALACAEEAARQAPRSVEAHQDRALALARLGRLDDARDAMTRALALAPDDPQTLEAAADLYVNQLPASAEHSAIGLEYARRGSRLLARGVRRKGKTSRRAALALLEGEALTDLGRAHEALRRLDASLALDPSRATARYERGVALFELCRFSAARRVFEAVIAAEPGDADALYHLALLDEREGHQDEADRLFAAATAADPEGFPPAADVSPARFAERLRAAVAALPADMQADLAGVPVETAEIPALDDLVAERPPLSPAIVGLFRGLPLGSDGAADAAAGRASTTGRPPASHGGADARGHAPVAPPRTIVLYRKNLLRTVRDEAELDRSITRTLLHEVGHLRGEDDGSLQDRGLE
jgi:tetratricopeptide (TPR) repeat protein